MQKHASRINAIAAWPCCPKDAARVLGVSPLTVARWTRQLNLSTVRTVGGHRRYPKETILRLLHAEGAHNVG